MMALGFRDSPNLVRKGQGLREVLEGVVALQMPSPVEFSSPGQALSTTPSHGWLSTGAHWRHRYISCLLVPWESSLIFLHAAFTYCGGLVGALIPSVVVVVLVVVEVVFLGLLV